GTEEMTTQLRTVGATRPWDTEIVRKDGVRVPILVGGALVEGVKEQAIMFMLDLTDLKRAEAAQALLASIVRSSEDAIIARTMEGTIVSWNGAAERLYGYSAEEAEGMGVAKLVPPDRADELPRIFRALERGENIR